MKYEKAIAEVISFENEDVIVTSPGDLQSGSAWKNFTDWLEKGYFLTCFRRGDSDRPIGCLIIAGGNSL